MGDFEKKAVRKGPALKSILKCFQVEVGIFIPSTYKLACARLDGYFSVV